jgi:hypothetical protein
LNENYAKKDIEIGGMLGGATYFGEINTLNPIHQIRPGAQILGRYNFHKQLALRGNLGFAMLSGKDAKSNYQYQTQRNLVFSSTVVSVSSSMEFNFLPFKADNARSVYSPYLSLGIGANVANWQFDSKFFNNFSIPFGVGVKVNMPERWNAGIEYLVNRTFRDDLDRIKDPQFGMADNFPYKQRANSKNSDWYTFFGFYIAYKLKSSVTCQAYTMNNNTMY